jgi:para-nitrobenzyl esterase
MHRIISLFTVLALRSVVARDGPEVQLVGGKVRGVTTAGSGSFFLGLPFASPPVGQAGRWMPPQPLDPWSGTLDASKFKPACAQVHDWTGQPEKPSEDCLYLDVYTPHSSFGDDLRADPLAVVLFIHGGGFTGGDSAGGMIGPNGPVPGVPGSERFNGTYMAEAQQVIVVSVNYRLGVFGFLGSKELDGRSSSVLGRSYGTGNYGVQDQRAAMAWTQVRSIPYDAHPAHLLTRNTHTR